MCCPCLNGNGMSAELKWETLPLTGAEVYCLNVTIKITEAELITLIAFAWSYFLIYLNIALKKAHCPIHCLSYCGCFPFLFFSAVN